MHRLKILGWGLIVSAIVTGSLTVAVMKVVSLNQPAPPTQTQEDFSVLRSHLQAKNWQAADAETRRILDPWIHQQGDFLSPPAPTNIPPTVLQSLDRLWVEASNGQFGFSVQQRIWAEVRSQHPTDSAAAVKAFGDRVGWTRTQNQPDPTFIAHDWLIETELNSSLEAPAGHLPWVGVDWQRISAMMSAQSCGSCTIDAMYVQGERFNQYIPTLFDWIGTALSESEPISR
ncbi:GUN4 domain-containing protein [Geitlerinema splendidum]|nr:GUN4 domain-containing protein [Geitlerinema splendidum]